MSGLHRALERAERERNLPWRRGDDERASDAPASEERRPSALAPEGIPDTGAALSDEPQPLASYSRVAEGPLSPLFVAATHPGGFAAQQYRFLRTRLEGRRIGKGPHVWLVTSPCAGDGKTTTSANLALTMAREFQQRVVLVEADLLQPRLALLFGVAPGPGLVDVLLGASSLDETLVEVADHRLCLLPAGVAAAPSSELVGSTMMPRLMEVLRSRFTRIVIDTPPAVAADTHVLVRHANSVLVVVRAGKTPRSALARTLGLIDRQQLSGIVLNVVDTAPDGYGYPGAETVGSE